MITCPKCKSTNIDKGSSVVGNTCIGSAMCGAAGLSIAGPTDALISAFKRNNTIGHLQKRCCKDCNNTFYICPQKDRVAHSVKNNDKYVCSSCGATLPTFNNNQNNR